MPPEPFAAIRLNRQGRHRNGSLFTTSRTARNPAGLASQCTRARPRESALRRILSLTREDGDFPLTREPCPHTPVHRLHTRPCATGRAGKGGGGYRREGRASERPRGPCAFLPPGGHASPTQAPIHARAPSFIHPLIPSSTPSFIRSLHSFAHSFIHSLTHSLAQALPPRGTAAVKVTLPVSFSEYRCNVCLHNTATPLPRPVVPRSPAKQPCGL